jgi:hypothetical protein
MQKIIFATSATPGKSTRKALMLTNSIRSFGGKFCNDPVWLLTPNDSDPFSEWEYNQMGIMNLEEIRFDIQPEFTNIPFTKKVFAAAFAERHAEKLANLLVWLDNDTIILKEPSEFELHPKFTFGYRPVHHKLIGISWHQELDSYWNYVYKTFKIQIDTIRPVKTHLGEQIYPYFNAGSYVIRPEKHLLHTWKQSFIHNYDDLVFQSFSKENRMYKIFFHQVIFTGVMLKSFGMDEMQELSRGINYPLHLHEEIPEKYRADKINELISVRYEDIFDGDWENELSILEPMSNWLKCQINNFIEPEINNS